jgi:competence protein ComEC
LPWVPVAFGAGIAGYFTATHEPVLLAPLMVAAVLAIATIVARSRPIGFPLLLGLAAIASGFAMATVKAWMIAHPVLRHPVSGAEIRGWIETREERERTDRIMVRVEHIDASRLEDVPTRVRVAVRKGTAPSVGAFIEFKARLNPPLAPLRPGGYDFARDLYFQDRG